MRENIYYLDNRVRRESPQERGSEDQERLKLAQRRWPDWIADIVIFAIVFFGIPATLGAGYPLVSIILGVFGLCWYRSLPDGRCD